MMKISIILFYLILIISSCGAPSTLSYLCIKGDCQNGQGSLLIKGGASYIGGFKDGRMQGYGTLIWANGDSYSGNWVRGYRWGQGILTLSDGRIFNGNFKNEY